MGECPWRACVRTDKLVIFFFVCVCDYECAYCRNTRDFRKSWFYLFTSSRYGGPSRYAMFGILWSVGEKKRSFTHV